MRAIQCRRTYRRRARRRLRKQEEIDQLRRRVLARIRPPSSSSSGDGSVDDQTTDSKDNNDEVGGESDTGEGVASTDSELGVPDDPIGGGDNSDDEKHKPENGQENQHSDIEDDNQRNVLDQKAEIADNQEELNEAVRVPLTEGENEAFLVRAVQDRSSSGGKLSMRKLNQLLRPLSDVFTSVPKSYVTTRHYFTSGCSGHGGPLALV